MTQPNSSGAIRIALLAVSVLSMSACADKMSQQITGGGASTSGPRYTVAVPEGMSLQCPPRPTVKSRSVEPGAEHDLNGNGVVCDEQMVVVGLPEGMPRPPAITTDDSPFPKTNTLSATP